MVNPDFAHEDVVVRRGRRTGLPVIVAVHSTAPGPALGGCRVLHYPVWTDGLADALRLSAAMTDKSVIAGLRHGGGKTVVPLPPGAELDARRRRNLLHDIGDVIDGLGGRYFTGPDVGTSAGDMPVVAERTANVFCLPREAGGSGDSSPATAEGVLAALRTVCGDFDGRAVGLVGFGHVGSILARELASAGARLTISDADPGRRAGIEALGARWASTEEVLTAELDVLIPAAVGGMLTDEVVAGLRCAAIAGPANNQLAHPGIADRLHERGILWAPDFLVSAGGVVYASGVEVDLLGHEEAIARVRGIGDTLAEVLAAAERDAITPYAAARRRIEGLVAAGR